MVTSHCIASATLISRNSTPQKTRACRRIFKEYINWFLEKSNSGDILIIAESMSPYSKNNKLTIYNSSNTQTSLSSSESIQIRAKEINDLAFKLENQGKTLIYVSGIPYLMRDPETCGQWFSSVNAPGCNSIDPKSKGYQYLPYTSISAQMKKSVIRADIFSAFEKDSTNLKGSLSEFFYNRDHINKKGALFIAPYLDKAIGISIKDRRSISSKR